MNLFGLKNTLFLLALLLSFSADSQKYLFSNITAKDGLASNIITDFYQDTKGFIWISTFDNGVSRFDGKNFINYNTSNGLPNNDVRDVMEDHEGNMWFATHGGGIAKLKNNEFTIYNEKDGLQNPRIYCITEDLTGDLWLSTWGGGIIRFDGESFKQYSKEEGVDQLQLTSHLDKNGNLWIGQHSGIGLGLYDHESDSFKFFLEDSTYHTGIVWDIEEDEEGNIWFSIQGYGLGKFNGEFFSFFANQEAFSKEFIPLELRNNEIWVGRHDNTGLVRWKGDAFTEIGKQEGLYNSGIWSLLVDDAGIIWIGTWGGGVFQLKDPDILHYTENYGLPEKEVYSMSSSEDGTIYLGTYSQGIYTLQDGTAQINQNEQLIGSVNNMMGFDGEGNLWIGQWNKGLYSYSNNRFQFYDFPKAYQTFATDHEGKPIFGCHLSQGAWQFQKRNELLQIKASFNNDITGIATDKEGKIYLATHGSILIVKDTIIDTLLADEGFADFEVGQLMIDEFGLLWMSHPKGGGFTIYDTDDRSWQYISKKQGLTNTSIKGFDRDKQGNIWVATGGGIFKISHQTKDEFNVHQIVGEAGLKNLQCTNILVDETNHRLIVSVSNDGIYEIPINSINKKPSKPKLHIQNLWIDDSLMSIEPFMVKSDTCDRQYKIELAYYENNFSIELIGLDFNDPEGVRFKWTLNGLDTKWHEPEDLHHINYTNLEGGDYLLEIVAYNRYGEESDPIRVEINVGTPFWKASWFYLLVFIFIIIAIYIYIRLREKKLRKQTEVLETQVSERTLQLKKANEDLTEQKIQIEEAHKEIKDSIDYAKRIQQAILPPTAYLTEKFPDSFVFYKPKDVVAGDFYWMAEKDDTFYIAAADCTGHGVPGAMVSVICNSSLNRSVNEFGCSTPGEILDKTRELVIKEFEKSTEDVKDGMDIAMCAIDGMTVKFAGAHNPLWIIRKNGLEVEQISADKQPIGKYTAESPFTTQEISVNKGDALYIFSDGYADQFGGDKGKKFKSVNFKSLLMEIKDRPMSEQQEIINETFENWRGSLEQIDDICVIGIRI